MRPNGPWPPPWRRAGALALLDEVRYVELSDRADFNDAFVEQLRFPD